MDDKLVLSIPEVLLARGAAEQRAVPVLVEEPGFRPGETLGPAPAAGTDSQAEQIFRASRHKWDYDLYLGVVSHSLSQRVLEGYCCGS